MKDNGYHRVLMRGSTAKNNGCSTLYWKDKTKVLHMKVEFSEMKNIMFRAEQGTAMSKTFSEYSHGLQWIIL